MVNSWTKHATVEKRHRKGPYVRLSFDIGFVAWIHSMTLRKQTLYYCCIVSSRERSNHCVFRLGLLLGYTPLLLENKDSVIVALSRKE